MPLLLLSMAMVGCGGDNIDPTPDPDPTPAPATVAVTGVTLNKTTLSLEKGASETLTATVAPDNATNKAVTWSTSDANVATVSKEGKVTARGAGTATITVKTTDGEKTATCAVTVTEPSGGGGGSGGGGSGGGGSGGGGSGGGESTPTINPGYYLVGNAAFIGEGTEWSAASGVASDTPSGTNHAEKKDLEVAANAELKIMQYVDGTSDNWFGYDDLGESYSFVEAPLEGDNIKITTKGIYSFYLNDQDKIYISQEATVKYDDTVSYKLKIGTAEYPLDKDEKDDYAHQLENFVTHENVDLSAAEGKDVKLFAGDTEISGFGLFAHGESSNVVQGTGENVGKLTVHNNSATPAKAHVKLWSREGNNNGYIYAGSVDMPGYEAPAQVAVTLSTTKAAGYGNAVYLVGDFCSWSPSNANALRFEYVNENVWSKTINVDVNTVYHCKLVVAAYESPESVGEWEIGGEGNERVITFTEATTLNLIWGSTGAA